MKTWNDDYMRLEIDPQRRLVIQVRTARAYEDIPIVTQSIESIVEQMGEIDRSQYALLQDLRLARGRNDPEFEATMATLLPRLSGGFRRVAVLVVTNIGRLQVQRYLERDGIPGRGFLDEAAALRWALEP
jgi:hypothetical protein